MLPWLEFALGPDAAAVAGDDVFADVQAQAHAAGAPRDRVFGLIEQAEDRLELVRWDPDARVLHAQDHAVALVSQPHADRARPRART